MSEDELTDIRTIARAVARIETKVDAQGARVDKLERFADRAEGALTLARFTLSILGIGGIALIVAALSQGRV